MPDFSSSSTAFDALELQYQISEVLALITSLRPDPEGQLISRAKLRILAAISGDDDLIRHVSDADDHTLFWDVGGEIISQKVSLLELPAG